MERSEEGGVIGSWLEPVAALEQFDPPVNRLAVSLAPEVLAKYGFRVAGFNFLIKAGSNGEVVQRPSVWPIPGSPQWFYGLLNLRSTLVPIYDLAGLLTREQGQSAAELVLVFGQGDRAVGVLIEDYPKPVTELAQLSMLPQLPDSISSHVRSGYLKDEAVWLEFDHETYFEEVVRQMSVQAE